VRSVILFQLDFVFRRKELRFRLRSWRVNAGGQSSDEVQFCLSHFLTRCTRSKTIGLETATRSSCGDARFVNAIRSSATAAAASRHTSIPRLILSRLWRHWRAAAQLFLRMIATFRPYPVFVSCNCLPTLGDPARAQHPSHLHPRPSSLCGQVFVMNRVIRDRTEGPVTSAPLPVDTPLR
jgi:hypothetical protein